MKVQYDIIRRLRQKHTYLRFKSGKLVVSTNLSISENRIKEFVEEQEPWIEQQRLVYEKQKNYNFEFVEGEKIIIFGEEYRLKLNQPNTFIDRNVFYVKKIKNVKNEVLKFCKLKLLEYYKERVAYWAKKMKLSYSEIKLNNAIRQWAHCSRDGKLVFSFKTIVLKKALIDYLIVHELSHLIYFNHSQAFYNLISLYIPDYKVKQNELKNFHLIAVAFVKGKESV